MVKQKDGKRNHHQEEKSSLYCLSSQFVHVHRRKTKLNRGACKRCKCKYAMHEGAVEKFVRSGKQAMPGPPQGDDAK